MKGFTYGAIMLFILCFSQQVAASNYLEACDTSECKEYFKAYKILTKRGHSEAMATLGELYYAGYGTEKNLEKALKWFRRAAKFGVVTAQYKAGVMYLQDTEHKDVDRGVNYLKRATKVDFSPASFVLGKIYISESFGLKDIEEADYWLSQAYKLKNYQAKVFSHNLLASDNSLSSKLTTLSALVNNDDFKLGEDGGLSSPKGEMETIVVTAPDYHAYFDAEIERLNNARPDTLSGTGSNIAGRTCAHLWGCSTEMDSLRVRDVLLSDWGRETVQFRIEGAVYYRDLR
ncbi:tetratricopeptide repeat protein [uncultured Shewanella sp.]|uniref:tetratricopeptide repeat protein n=1 Tax=Shewanella atlantica TaxID=271099 RepID=UPI00263424A4|nr:tetratricopeptide repeat protein [uncultured Shewanella sp.]